ncbi:hypothetical protein Tco_0970214 [Tanacetum coccineum]
MGTPTLVCVWSCPNLVLQLVGPLGCKVMKTLASVEIKIMLIFRIAMRLSSSSARCLADGAQSSRVPVPLHKDPYEAIRHAYLYGTDTESEPFEDPIETETPETARMVMRVPPAMSPGLSASMAEVATMSEFAFRKRFRSSYESSPSCSLPDLPSQKRYRGTSELVEDDDEEDEEIEESLDSDNMSEDAEDEGPTAEDGDPATGDEGLITGDEGPGMGVESRGLDDEGHDLDGEGHNVKSDGLGLREDEAVPEGSSRQFRTFEVGQGSGSAPEPERPERVSASKQPTLTTWIDLEDGMVYIDVPAYPPPAPSVQTPPSPEWSSGSLPISQAPSIIPLPISSPMIPLTVPSPVATPATAETEGFLTELGAQINAQRVALWHAISDTQGENQELRLQIAKERRAQLELAEIIDNMRRGQEPRGDV